MFYEWDEIKEKLNIAKHQVDFTEASSVFLDEYGLVSFDKDHSDDEERFHLLGLSAKNRILLVVHCYKQDNIIRIISARKATIREKQKYKEQI